MTDALQQLIADVRRGAPPESLIGALERWLVERAPSEPFPEAAQPAYAALLMETEALALLALLDGGADDGFPSDDWLELSSLLTWRRALLAKASEVDEGARLPNFDPELDLQLERRFGDDPICAPARALVRATWPDGCTGPKWCTALDTRDALDSADDADSEVGPFAGIVEWARGRQGGDGRVRLTAAEWDDIAATHGGEGFLSEWEHLFECVHEPISAEEWSKGGAVPSRPTRRGLALARVAVPPRLAASSLTASGAWIRGIDVLFQFAATRAWIHPGVGLLAAGQSPDTSVDGPPRAAWLVVPERGVTRVEWSGSVVEPDGLGGLVIPVHDPSVLVDVVVRHGAATFGVSLPSREFFGEGEVLLDDSGIDAELTEVLADIRAADFGAARRRLGALDDRLIPGERPTVDTLRALLASGGPS